MKIQHYAGFYDDDGSFQWRDFRRHLRSRYHVAVMRLDNRFQDARARLAGACNADLWNEETHDYDGGYSHWRCGKRRGHLRDRSIETEDGRNGAHRFNNYVWDGPGHKPVFAPLPIRNTENTGFFDSRAVIPFRKLAEGAPRGRHPTALATPGGEPQGLDGQPEGTDPARADLSAQAVGQFSPVRYSR